MIANNFRWLEEVMDLSLSLSHIFRKESQKTVTVSKVEPVVDRAIWR
jgi:hypothetical protein